MTALSGCHVNIASRKSLEIQAYSTTKPRNLLERKLVWKLVFSCSNTPWKWNLGRIHSFVIWILVTSSETQQYQLQNILGGVTHRVSQNGWTKHTLWRRTYLHSLYKGVPPGRKTCCRLWVSLLTQARLKRALTAGVSYPLLSLPLPFFLPPYPLHLSTPATHATHEKRFCSLSESVENSYWLRDSWGNKCSR